MPSINDVYTELQMVNANLQLLHGDLDNIGTGIQDLLGAVQHMEGTLQSEISESNRRLGTLELLTRALVQFTFYTNRVLHHQTQQNETLICVLDVIGRQTCGIQNEASAQTAIQTDISGHSAGLWALYQSEHAQTALAYHRIQEVESRVDECCPPEPAEPVCVYQPCEVPDRIEPPVPPTELLPDEDRPRTHLPQ